MRVVFLQAEGSVTAGHEIDARRALKNHSDGLNRLGEQSGRGGRRAARAAGETDVSVLEKKDEGRNDRVPAFKLSELDRVLLLG